MIEIFILSVVTALLATYAFIQHKYQYWKKLGVPYLPPTFPYGNRSKTTRQVSFLLQEFYIALKDSQSPIFGMYFMQRPITIVCHIELVKDVLIKDFQYFQDRGFYSNAEADPLSANLLTLDSDTWRKLRHKLSPTFTSGKMKFMYPTMIEVGHKFEQCLGRILSDGEQELELKELLARFTTDIIGTCAFGIECNSLDDPEAEFRRMGKKVFDSPRHSAIFSLLISSFPGLARWLGIKVFRDDVSMFFMKVVRETVAFREQNCVERDDFLDLLIALKNQKENSLTLNEIAAQAFIFFLAGFETSSTTMMFTLYELALNLDLQTKLRNEIKTVLSKHNGQFTYEAMMDMRYLDQVIHGENI